MAFNRKFMQQHNTHQPWSTAINIAIGFIGLGMVMVLILSTLHKTT
jgi:hypothetical protein